MTALLLAALLLAGALAGCSGEGVASEPREIAKTESYPVVVEAGSVSIEVPEGFAVPEGVDMGAPRDNAFGTIDNAITLAVGDDGRIALQLAEVTQKPDANVVGLQEIKESLEAAPERAKKYEQSMPEYYKSIKDMKYGEPELVVIGGRNALICENELNGTSMLACFVEQDGCVVASAQFTIPSSDYQGSENLYESILATIDVAA